MAFFVEGITTLGVQSVYRYNGVETRSAIVTINVDELSVDGPDADREVSEVRYYDVSGRELTEPAEGLVIKRVTYSDGSVASFKRIVR